MGVLVMMVDSKESQQTKRFRWREGATAFYVTDTETGRSKCMGDGVDLFCDSDGGDCLPVGTQRFYDALNSYFNNEQTEIAMAYFNVSYSDGEEVASNG